MKKPGREAGGKAAAKKLSPQQRKERAKKAALSRWDKSILRAIHGRNDHPLVIGNIRIPCFVLSDGTRVLLQKETALAIGMSNSNSSQLSEFAEGKTIGSFFKDKKISDLLNSPLKFRTTSGSLAHGYEATILPDICDAVLEARAQGHLLKGQENIAAQCEIIMRGLAKVGIIALIDEATGYQADRTKDALVQILESFVTKTLQPYLKTLPSCFYEEMFRLRGLLFDLKTVKRPQDTGEIINNIVYDRIPLSIREELKKKTSNNGLVKNKGHLKLFEHLGSVVAIMKLSDNWKDFMDKLDRIHPTCSHQYTPSLEYNLNDDDGKKL